MVAELLLFVDGGRMRVLGQWCSSPQGKAGLDSMLSIHPFEGQLAL
jgi:hypothetical protein